LILNHERYFCRDMHHLTRRSTFLVMLVALLSSCTINRDIMFKTPTDHQFESFQDSASDQLKLQANDVFQFRLFANDGFKIIDLVSEGAIRDAQFLNRNVFQYFIEYDGMVKMPLLGRVMLRGLSVREAELMLEERYTQYYNRPFVQLVVNNRRAVVFPGEGGDAQIIPLDNQNTTLLEVLAAAGGIARRGNASRVKLFRLEENGSRKVYQFDLSTIEGLRYADIVMQGDDVLYVEPNPELAREFLQDLTPIVTLLTSVVLVIGIVRGFN
jgi:polysaccharide export outer membrane protein